MRICRIAEQFPPAPSGLAPGILELSLEQHRRGHEVLVLAPEARGAEGSDAQLPFPVVRLPGSPQMLFGLRAARALLALRRPPDIVHVHGVGGLPYLLLPARHRAPVVATVHSLRRVQYPLMRSLDDVIEPVREILGGDGLPDGRSYSPLRPKVLQEYMTERLICTRAMHLALVADHMRAAVERLFGVDSSRCCVTYNGTSLARRAEEKGNDRHVRRSLKLAPLDEVILFVGRLTWLKRPHLPVMALPALLRERPRAKLVCVGGGPLEGMLRGLAGRLGVSQSVRFVPWVPFERVEAFYRAARCLCLPSISEGMPKVVLDAMAAGVPVVASDIPAHRDLLEDGRLGTLVREPLPACWAAAIRSALGSRLALTKAGAAERRVDERYRWSHVAERLDEAYRAALEAAASVLAATVRIA